MLPYFKGSICNAFASISINLDVTFYIVPMQFKMHATYIIIIGY